MGDKISTVDRTSESQNPANKAAPVDSTFGNASINDVRAATKAMQSAPNEATLHPLKITAKQSDTERGTTADIDRRIADTPKIARVGTKSSESDVSLYSSVADGDHANHGMEVSKQTLERSATAIKETENFLTGADTSADDKLKAAGVLAANGVAEIKDLDGTQYKFGINAENIVNLKTTSVSGQTFEFSGKLNADGSQLIKDKNKDQEKDQEKDQDKETDKAKTGNDTPLPQGGNPDQPQTKPTGKDALFDPSLSLEDKLKAAREMADHGQKRFKGPDGKDYEISTHKYGSRESVAIFQSDGKGHAHALMRGIVDDKGIVTGQHDGKGKSLDFQSDWAKKNGTDNPLVRHDEKIDKPAETGDKNKLEGTPEEQKQLDASRERLKHDAAQNIENPKDRERFTNNMDALEQRAKSQPLSAREVSETYDQLSKLLEAKDAAVPKADRVLAAETFAHHMGTPTNIDQGFHNTCNMTSLEEHLITRNPSKAAEIVSTMAQTGHWTAPDGRDIKITPASLVPGPEERDNPPADNHRSYATQLMNLALVNDANQRKIPPQFYSQERPTGQGDTGERLRYADGKDVTRDDASHNGDKTPLNAPDVHCEEISQVGQSINGDSKFLIANGKVDNSDSLVHVNSADDLRTALADMKANHKLPAVIMVDSNSAAFGGDPSRGPGFHVVSVTGFDETTGKVSISNQWGKANDRDMNLEDLYRSTYTS